jgi:hypothetical protein
LYLGCKVTPFAIYIQTLMIVGDEKNRDEDLSPLECLKTLEILKPVKNDKPHAREHRDCIIGIKS